MFSGLFWMVMIAAVVAGISDGLNNKGENNGKDS